MSPRSQASAQRPALFRPVALAVLFFSIALLLVIADRAPLHLDKRNPDPPIISDFYRHYTSVLDGSIGGPYAYRVLVPWITALAHRMLPWLAEIDIDAILKLLLLFLVQATFFWSQRRFFPPWIALSGVLWMDVLIGYSLAYVLGPASGETTDLFNLLVFILALEFVHDRAIAVLTVLFMVGMVNRETPLLLLPLVYAIDRSEKRGVLRSAIVISASVGVYVGLRLTVHATGGGWFTTQGLAANVPGYQAGMEMRALQSVVHVLVLLAPLFALALLNFRQKPLLFRGSVLLAGVLVGIHFFVATIIESRLWMPVYALLIPPSLHTLGDMFKRLETS